MICGIIKINVTVTGDDEFMVCKRKERINIKTSRKNREWFRKGG